MSRTFYLAASSGKAVEAYAAMCDLSALGLVNLMDWTAELGAHEARWPLLASADTHASVSADLFVMLAEPQSHGSMFELGARVGAGHRAHVVGVPWHLFMRHPLVASHRDWVAFLDAVRGGRA